MELRNLNTFKVVAELRGFTRAAEVLGYAQSSITMQIQALEEELGTPLFDRLGKKIVLTDAGKRLLPYATELLKLHDQAKAAVGGKEMPSGTLIIGAPESLAAYRLPPIIREYRTRHPHVKIILKPGQCWELRNQVRSGELDLAFLLDQEIDAPDLHTERLVIERMALIAPPDHRLVCKERVTAADLADETILQTESGCSYRRLFEQQLQREAVLPKTMLEFWNIETIKNCVMAGLGLSFLPRITVQKELAAGEFVALNWDDAPSCVVTQMAVHKGKWISPALHAFMTVVHEHSKHWE
jgi:DNA-binding transcriptional LysR family regulator